MDTLANQTIQQHQARILGYLVRFLGDFDQAEDIQHEVIITALESWQRRGLPANPLAWLFTTARNKAPLCYAPSPVAQLNHTVALLMTNQLTQAEDTLQQIEEALSRYSPYYCARAELYTRQKKMTEALGDLKQAIRYTSNKTEQAFLERKITELNSTF